MPEVMDEFHTGLGSAGWLVAAYVIAMASLQPVAGKIGDSPGCCRLIPDMRRERGMSEHRHRARWGMAADAVEPRPGSVSPGLG